MPIIGSTETDFHVLLVEDNDDHVELIRRSFGEHGLAECLWHVPDGEAALDYMFGRNGFEDRTIHPLPDIVLLDLRLPKVDGLDVLRAIKSSSALLRIPVIVLTTSDDEIDLARAYEAHANSYLVKPVEFENFKKLARELNVYWRELNRSCT